MAVLPPTGMIASTPAMFFFSARYAVDTFFFISGYLVMSGMLKVSSVASFISDKLFDCELDSNTLISPFT
jgi:peptidoglycan/LPS O-acetylase OafA/YrhL